MHSLFVFVAEGFPDPVFDRVLFGFGFFRCGFDLFLRRRFRFFNGVLFGFGLLLRKRLRLFDGFLRCFGLLLCKRFRFFNGFFGFLGGFLGNLLRGFGLLLCKRFGLLRSPPVQAAAFLLL